MATGFDPFRDLDRMLGNTLRTPASAFPPWSRPRFEISASVAKRPKAPRAYAKAGALRVPSVQSSAARSWWWAS